MRTKYLYFLLLLTSFLSVSNAQEIGYPIIRNYTSKEYNNSSQVMSAIQSNSGIIYFGVGDGVMQYDGVSWRNIPIEKQAIAFDFAKDKNGKIYVAANGDFGYLDTDNKGNSIYRSLTYLIGDTAFILGAVNSVKVTSKFTYFQTYDEILQYTSAPENLQIFKADTNGRFFGDFVLKDTYYVRLAKKGLMKIEDNKLKPANQSSFFNSKNGFKTALPYNSGTMLIPTRTDGLYLYKPYNDTVPQKFNISYDDFIVDNNIYMSSSFLKKYFVLGSLKKGALLIDKHGTALQHYHESNLLQNNLIVEITIDTTQNLWFGLNNGISKTEHSLDLSYWDKNSGLKNTVYSIIRYNGIVYLATGTIVYFIDKNNQIQEVKNIPAGQNWSFLETKKSKSLLVGTSGGIYEIIADTALQIYKGRPATTLGQSTKNPERIFSTDDDLFISLKYQNGIWMSEGKWEGIKDDIRRVVEDEKGEIWLGTYRNGVIRITPNYDNISKPKKVRYYNLKDGFASLKEILPFKLKNRIIWGTEKGLYIYNSETDRFEPFCELGEQFCNGSRDVYSLIEMADGKIWICPLENKKADIGYLQPNKKGAYDWIYAPFRRIPDMFLDAFYIDDLGIAWIGGSEGVYRYDMGKDTKYYAQKFNCLIRKITIGEDSLIYGGNTLNPSEFKNSTGFEYKFNTIKFEFAAPFFDCEEKTLYSYQLEGFDKGWSKWARETKKEYTNLPEGTYTIKVKALNVYGAESEIDTYQITVQPPFYRTWWAYGIYAIVLFMFIWIIVKINTLRLINEKERLENIVKERTYEIMQQNEEILTQNEEIQAQNDEMFIHKNEIEKQAAKLREQNTKLQELGEFKQGMTSMIVHDLKNPLNLIINVPKSIDFEKQNSIMQQSGKQMLNMVLNILDVDKYEDMSMNLNLEDKQFVLIAINAINQIKFLGEQKEISINNQIEHNLFLKVEEEIAERVLVNILTNAIKYTPLNGSITLSSNPISETFVRIEVQDTGEGIPQDKIHLVFQKFGQVVAKKSGGVRSTGLGLTFCKLAVEAHGGQIGVNSEVGKGTTFWFTLQTGTPKNSLIEIIEEKIEIKDEPIQFTEQEKAILEPVIKRLNLFLIYETTDIEEVIAELKDDKAENIQKWINLVKTNLITLNQAKYVELLKLNN